MNYKILALCVLWTSFTACNKKNENMEPVVPKDMPSPETLATRKACYESVRGNDTITLTLAMNANNASGELSYNFFEKDKNKGTFSGVFIGDTLYSDYIFQSEGVTSVRETVFLKRGNALIQGFGEMTEKDNKQVFKDSKKLVFDSSIVLNKVDCR